jgi:hypothetical protein
MTVAHVMIIAESALRSRHTGRDATTLAIFKFLKVILNGNFKRYVDLIKKRLK